MKGCRPHDCDGYAAIIALDVRSGEFFLYEWGDHSRKSFFGRDDPNVRALLETLREDSLEEKRAARKAMQDYGQKKERH